MGIPVALVDEIVFVLNFCRLVSFCYVTLSACDFEFWVAKTFQKSFRQLVSFANCLVTFQPCHILFGKQLPPHPPYPSGGLLFKGTCFAKVWYLLKLLLKKKLQVQDFALLSQ